MAGCSAKRVACARVCLEGAPALRLPRDAVPQVYRLRDGAPTPATPEHVELLGTEVCGLAVQRLSAWG